MKEKLETMLRLLVARVELQEGAHARIITRVNFQAWQPPCWPIVHGIVKISRITHRGWKLAVSPIRISRVSCRRRIETRLCYMYVHMNDKLFFSHYNLCFVSFFIIREISCNCMHFIRGIFILLLI